MMNSKRVVLAVAALATFGCGTVMMAAAQTPAPGSAPAAGVPGPHHGPRHFHFRGGPGGPLVGTLLRAVHQVEKAQPTSAAGQQIAKAKTTIQGLLQADRQSHRPGAGGPGPNSQVEAAIASGSFTAAAAAEAQASQARITAEGALAESIYNSLGPDAQKAVLAQIAADQAKAQQRRQQWAARHHQQPAG